MEIEINYNGTDCECYVKTIVHPYDKVNILDVDSVNQDLALHIFNTIGHAVRKKQRENYYLSLPVTFYRQEFQAIPENFSEVLKLHKSGNVIEFKCDGRHLSFRLKDGYAVIEDGGWCIQGNDGRWFGINNEMHDFLKAHNKLVKL